MNGKFLLDTNIIVALFKNDQDVRSQIATAPEVFVPIIAIGELLYGAKHSVHVQKNVGQIRQFAAATTVIHCDLGTAECYGQIKNDLKVKGRPLPENDIWIAAIAVQHSFTVVTRDEHFKEIDHLLLAEW